jgi:hypothetical protein
VLELVVKFVVVSILLVSHVDELVFVVQDELVVQFNHSFVQLDSSTVKRAR